MIMLDKARASLWIKIGAVIIIFAFVLAYIPLASTGALGDFFRSIFQSGSSSQTGQAQANIILLKEKLKKNSKDIKTLDALGNAYYDQQKFQEAIVYYQMSLALKPDDYSVMTDMGACYFALKQTDKALEIFKKVTSDKPDQVMAWYNLGIVYKSKNDTPNMRFAWERFLALQPTGQQADQVRQQLSPQSQQQQ